MVRTGWRAWGRELPKYSLAFQLGDHLAWSAWLHLPSELVLAPLLPRAWAPASMEAPEGPSSCQPGSGQGRDINYPE